MHDETLKKSAMPRGLLTAVMLLVILLGTSSAFAQEEMAISCDGAPDAAVVEMPDLVGDIAAVHCTVYGHLIAGPKGVTWNYPGAFYPVIVPAQMVQDEPEVVNHDFYFQKIEARVLGSDEANSAYMGFLEGFDERDDSAPTVIELAATNQQGIVQKVYFFGVSEDAVWGYTCQTTCKPEEPFMVIVFETRDR